MRIPPSIAPGDTIGLAAPSFGAAVEPYITRLAASIRAFEARGYRVRTAPSCYKSDGLGISTNPADAAKDLTDLYLDDSVDAVFSVGGGELMNETISHVDFAKLAAAPPKWFLGYSDNTNFIFPMALLGNTAGIYGPCATGFGKPWEETEKNVFGILEGTVSEVRGLPLFELPEAGSSVRAEDPLAPYQLTEKTSYVTMLPAKDGFRRAEPDEEAAFSGTLIGGCLDVLVNLSGTPYDGTSLLRAGRKDAVWVIEACDLSPMAIRRSLWSLRMQGWFDGAAGFLVGRPLAALGQDMMGVNQYNAVTDVLAGIGAPVVMDADIGHVPPVMPLVIGAEADVKVRGDDLRIAMKLGH